MKFFKNLWTILSKRLVKTAEATKNDEKMEKQEWPSWYTNSEKVELAKNGIYFDLDGEEDFPELKEYFEQKDAKATNQSNN